MDNKELSTIDKTIEEMKEKQKFSLGEKKKTLEEIHLDEEVKLKQEDLEREQLLDKEINRINEMIKNSNPKWILDDFDEFIYKKFDKETNRELIEVKIADKKNAMELINIISKLKDNNGANNFLRIIWDKDIFYKAYKRELDEEKILQLIKGWVFYANTKVSYDKLKFTECESKVVDVICSILAILTVIFIPIIIIAIIIWLMIVL